MSETCQAVAFGHSSGSLHLFGKGDALQFNGYSVPTLFVDPVRIEFFILIHRYQNKSLRLQQHSARILI
jgi:hypothetical protein